MKINKAWLEKKGACEEGVGWFLRQDKSEAVEIINALMDDNHFDWANWLIVRVIKREQSLAYAIYAAEQVLNIYEAKFPDDDRPRKAIEAAKNYLKSATPKNKAAADADTAAAAYAAYAAAHAAAADADAATAAYAAYAAADAAAAHAYAAYADAADAAYAAADAAAYAAYAAYAAAAYALKKNIINYGISLLEGGTTNDR